MVIHTTGLNKTNTIDRKQLEITRIRTIQALSGHFSEAAFRDFSDSFLSPFCKLIDFQFYFIFFVTSFFLFLRMFLFDTSFS